MGLGVLKDLSVVPVSRARGGDEALASAQRTRRSLPASRIDLTNARVLQPIDPLEVGVGTLKARGDARQAGGSRISSKKPFLSVLSLPFIYPPSER